MTNELQHYGILGMKWGIRRYQNYDGTLTEAGKKRYSTGGTSRASRRAAKKARARAVKEIPYLSDEELKRRVDRLEMEKKYRELTESEIVPGKTYVNGILTDVGKKVAVTALTGAGIYGLSAIASKSFDRKALGAAILNGGAKKK